MKKDKLFFKIFSISQKKAYSFGIGSNFFFGKPSKNRNDESLFQIGDRLFSPYKNYSRIAILHFFSKKITASYPSIIFTTFHKSHFFHIIAEHAE